MVTLLGEPTAKQLDLISLSNKTVRHSMALNIKEKLIDQVKKK